MSASIRFTFDRDFDDAAADGGSDAADAVLIFGEGDAAAEALAPPAPLYGEDDLARARADGFAEGHAQGLAAAADSQSRRLGDVLDVVAGRLADLDEDWRRLDAMAAQTAVAVAVAISRKLFPETSRRQALTEIEGVAAEVFARVARRPSLVVRVAPHLREAAVDRLGIIAERSGYAGAVAVVADAALTDGDCRVDWATGGAARDTRALWQAIEAAVEEYCDAGMVRAPESATDMALLPKPSPAAASN